MIPRTSLDQLDPALIDLRRLTAWAEEHLPKAGGPIRVERITSGGSNELFEIGGGTSTWVLRRPLATPQDRAASNSIMAREFRVLSALEGSLVPHPAAVALCVDTTVIGAAFYVMEKITGFTTDGRLPSVYASSIDAQRAIGIEAVDALGALHAVDWRSAGLEDFGKPDGFLERQVDRWLGHLERNRVRDVPGIDDVATWLRSERPADSAPAIMHGDYTPHNWMFSSELPARLVAVIDWEQCTIGDPLMDLGHLLAGWADPSEEDRFASYVTPRDGMVSRAEIIARYAAASGRDVTRVEYYEVLAMFKLACVLEGNYRLFSTGASTNPKHERAGALVLELARAALATIGGLR